MVNAECILLAVRGRYFYGESFSKFISIQGWEYEQILKNPHLYYFSTAFKKHFEWCEAARNETAITFSEAVKQYPATVKFPPPPHEVPEPEKVPFEKLPRKAEPAQAVPQRSPASARKSFRLRILNLL